MSTYAAIGLVNKDSSITGVYCCYDGYLHGVGTILLKNYTTTESVQKLLELGSMKFLGCNIWATEYLGRDLKQPAKKSVNLVNVEDFERYFHNMIYYYLFQDGNWVYRQNQNELGCYYSLKDAIDNIYKRSNI